MTISQSAKSPDSWEEELREHSIKQKVLADNLGDVSPVEDVQSSGEHSPMSPTGERRTYLPSALLFTQPCAPPLAPRSAAPGIDSGSPRGRWTKASHAGHFAEFYPHPSVKELMSLSPLLRETWLSGVDDAPGSIPFGPKRPGEHFPRRNAVVDGHLVMACRPPLPLEKIAEDSQLIGWSEVESGRHLSKLSSLPLWAQDVNTTLPRMPSPIARYMVADTDFRFTGVKKVEKVSKKNIIRDFGIMQRKAKRNSERRKRERRERRRASEELRRRVTAEFIGEETALQPKSGEGEDGNEEDIDHVSPTATDNLSSDAAIRCNTSGSNVAPRLTAALNRAPASPVTPAAPRDKRKLRRLRRNSRKTILRSCVGWNRFAQYPPQRRVTPSRRELHVELRRLQASKQAANEFAMDLCEIVVGWDQNEGYTIFEVEDCAGVDCPLHAGDYCDKTEFELQLRARGV